MHVLAADMMEARFASLSLTAIIFTYLRHVSLSCVCVFVASSLVDLDAPACAPTHNRSADSLGAPCKVEFNDVHAGHREPLSPILQGPLHSVWKPSIDLKQVFVCNTGGFIYI